MLTIKHGLQLALTGQGREKLVSEKALPFLSFLIELLTPVRHDPIPQPEKKRIFS